MASFIEEVISQFKAGLKGHKIEGNPLAGKTKEQRFSALLNDPIGTYKNLTKLKANARGLTISRKIFKLQSDPYMRGIGDFLADLYGTRNYQDIVDERKAEAVQKLKDKIARASVRALEHKLEKEKKKKGELRELKERFRKSLEDDPRKFSKDVRSYVKMKSDHLAALAEKLQRKEITINQFSRAMSQEIKKMQTAAMVMGRGGVLNVDKNDPFLKGKIERERYFLKTFIKSLRKKIKKGEPIDGNDIRRAAQYAHSVHATAQEALRQFLSEESGFSPEERRVTSSSESCNGCEALADLGWQPIGTLPPIGSQECGSWCLCQFEFRSGQEAADSV